MKEPTNDDDCLEGTMLLAPIPLYRGYELSCEDDVYHQKHGRCPEYALDWLAGNLPHWPPGHNYVVGDGVGAETFSVQRRVMAQVPLDLKRLVFCDLDGVLADFDAGVQALNLGGAKASGLWPAIHRVGGDGFYAGLPWTAHGKELWQGLCRLLGQAPVILTGSTCAKFSRQKELWCRRELGADVRVICCATKDKPNYCVMRGAVLIDDRDKVADAWASKRGVFVRYVPGEERRVLREVRDAARYPDMNADNEFLEEEREEDSVLAVEQQEVSIRRWIV